MSERIDAVFFDMGGTLRYRIKDSAEQAEVIRVLAERLGVESDLEAFYARLVAHALDYKRWAEETLYEAPEEEIWTKWMLPDRDPSEIRPMAVELEHLWRATHGRRVARSDTKPVIEELHRRGYELGMISNTTSREAVPRDLVAYGIAEFFPVVVLSTSCGHRKPGTRIFETAVNQLGVEANRCAYVGDRPSRDVLGSKNAGFAASILICDQRADGDESVDGLPAPDHCIQSLSELLDILPERE